MPETITAYNTFTPNTSIKSSEVNANFSNHRGTLLPIETGTAAASDVEYNLGSYEYNWQRTHTQSVAFKAVSTAPSYNLTSGHYEIYVKTDGTVQLRNASGTSSEIGAGGSGSGGINYVEQSNGNHDAETDTTGWTTYADGATAPSDLTGGTATATFTRTTTDPLRGTGSFLYTAGALGNGAYYTITPDRADIKRGSVQHISFDYEYDGTVSTGSYQIWIYDVANSALLQPAGYQVQGGVSGQAYKHQPCSFQLPTTGTTFRVGLHQAATTPGGNIKIDNFSVGPQAIQYGAAITDWTSYTPTLGWGGSVTPTGRWRRVGDSMECEIRIAVSAGGPTAVNCTVSLPSGYTIDSTKLTDPSSGGSNLGFAEANDSGTSHLGKVVYNTSTTVRFTGDDGAGSWTDLIPFTFSAGDSVYARFTVPISGWSSSVQMSTDTDTRVVAAKAHTSSTSIANGATTTCIFGTKAFDTHNAYSTSTGLFTVPVPGFYRVDCLYAGSAVSGSGAIGNTETLRLLKNGSSDTVIGHFQVEQTGTGVVRYLSGSSIVSCVAGDTLGVAINNPDSTFTGANNSTATWVSFERLSGPSAIAASETVHMHYQNAASTAFTGGAGATDVPFATKVSDSHSSFSSPTWTAPVSGLYLIDCNVMMQAASFSGTQAVFMSFVINGTAHYAFEHVGNGSSVGRSLHGTKVVAMLAGQTVKVQLDTDVSFSLNANGNRNFLSITRIGNYI